MRLWVAIVVVGLALPAQASPVEIFGLTPRRAAQANTGVAAAEDASAVYYGPANLVVRPGGELVVGTLAAYSHLQIEGDIARLAHPFGFQLAVRQTVHDRVALGLAVHLLPRDLSTIRTRFPEEPFYPYYGDRLSRVVALPGIAVRAGGGLSLGVAANASTEAVRAIAGARFDASKTLRFGLVYRQRFDVPFETLRDGRLLRGSGQFTPDQVATGVAYTNGSLISTLDITYARWSTYPGPFLRPDLGYRNTVAVRAGLDSDTTDGIAYRVGYGFEQSPIPRTQRHMTNLLDGNKHVVAAGLGYAIPRGPRNKPMRIDAHVQLHIVATRMTNEIKSGGEVVVTGLSVEVGL